MHCSPRTAVQPSASVPLALRQASPCPALPESTETSQATDTPAVLIGAAPALLVPQPLTLSASIRHPSHPHQQYVVHLDLVRHARQQQMALWVQQQLVGCSEQLHTTCRPQCHDRHQGLLVIQHGPGGTIPRAVSLHTCSGSCFHLQFAAAAPRGPSLTAEIEHALGRILKGTP